MNETLLSVIGYIDAYGAIHHRPVYLGGNEMAMHSYYWPMQTHKLWRFDIRDWKLEDSVLTKEFLTAAEIEDLYAFMRKHYTPPLWVIQGEEWEALGRPRSGEAYEAHCKKWEKIYKSRKGMKT